MKSKPGDPVEEIPQVHMSTRHLPASQQYDAWRSMMAPPGEFSLPSDTSAADGFVAHRSIFNLGSIIVTTEQSSPVLFEFGPSTARKGGFDHLFVGVVTLGGQSVETGETITSTGPGSLVSFSMDQPRRGRSHGLKGIGVCISRGLHDELAGIGSIPVSTENSSMEQLLKDFLITFGQHLPRLKAIDATRAAKAMTLMISTCLEPSGDNLAKAGKIIEHVRFERARRYIKTHLSFPTLTVEEVCCAIGVSRAQLYRLFNPVGGIATEIRRQRLLAAHHALGDVSDHRKIYQIAHDLGFSSTDDLGRAFRREFGYSPKEAREEARQSPRWTSAQGPMSGFESMLQRLARS